MAFSDSDSDSDSGKRRRLLPRPSPPALFTSESLSHHRRRHGQGTGSGSDDGSDRSLVGGSDDDWEQDAYRGRRDHRERIRWLIGGVTVLLILCIGVYLGWKLWTRSSVASTSAALSTDDSSPQSAPSNAGSASLKGLAASSGSTTSLKAANQSSTSTSSTSSSAPSSPGAPSSSFSASSSSSSSSSASSPSETSGAGLAGVSDPVCGDSGAVSTPTKGGGPNGSQAWLNCGISKANPDSKWTPPTVQISQLKFIGMDEAIEGVFKPCTPYVSLFNTYGAANDLPPILLARIAMTESDCLPGSLGDINGAFGLTQITADKCKEAPNGDCRDPDYNVKTGAAYLKTVLTEHKGNVLLALGSYNGWYNGLTYNGVTAAATSGCCVCQNNLDYLQSILNGFSQGEDGYTLGTINNLAVCG